MSGPQSHDLKMAPKTLPKARDSFCRLRTRQSTPSASRQNTNCVSRHHQWSRYQWDCQRRERRQSWSGMAVIVLIPPNWLHCHIWEGDHSNSLVIGFRWIRPQARQSWPTEQIPACCGCTSSDPGELCCQRCSGWMRNLEKYSLSGVVVGSHAISAQSRKTEQQTMQFLSYLLKPPNI